MSITPETIAKSKGMHAFEVVNPSHGGNGSTWIFTVDTDEEVRNWISNIRRAVAGIKSFSPSADFGLMDDAEKRPPPTQQSYGDRPLSVGPALPLTSSLQLSEDLDVDSQVRIQRKLQDQLEQQRSQQGSWSEDSVPKAPSSSQSGETGVKFQAAISPQQHLQQHGVHLSSSTPERTIFQPAAPPHRGPLSAADGPRVSSNASQTAANAGTVLPVSYLPKSSSQRGPQNPLQSTKSGGVQGPPPVQQNFALVPQPSSQYSSTSSLPTRSPGVQHSQMKGLIPGVVESTNLQTQGAAYPTRSPGPQHAAMMQGGRSPGPQLSMMHPSGTIPSRNPGSQPPNSFSDPNLATRSPGPQNAVMAYGGGMLSSRSPGPMHGTLQHPLRASENYGPPQTGSSALASDSPSPQYAAMPAKSPATRLAQMSISSGSFQAKSPAQQLSQMQPRISQGQWGQTNLPTRSPGPQYGQMQALGADVGQSPMVHSVVMNRAPGLIAPNSTVQQELEQQYRFQPNPQDLLMNQQRGSQNPPLRQTDPGFAAVQTQAHTEQIAWQNSSQFSRNQLQVQPQFQQEPQSQPQQQFQPQQHLQQQLQLQLQVQQNQISQGQLPVQPETFNPNFSSIQQRPGGPMQIQVGPRRSLDNQAGIGHNGPLSAPAIQDGIRNGFGGPMSAANPVRASLAYSPALRPQAFAHNMMQQQQMQHQHMQLQQIQQQQTQQQRVGISQLVRSSSMQGSPAYIAQMALLRQHEEQQRQQQIAQMQQQQQLQQLQQASQEQQLLMQQYQLQQQIQHQLQLQQQMQDFQHNFDQRQNLQLQSQGFAMPNSLGPRSASAYAGGVGTVNSAAPLWPGGNINGMGSRIETPSSVPSGMNFNASVGLSLGTPGMDGSFGPGLSSGMGNMDMLTSMAPKRPVSTSVAAYGNVPSATYRRPSTGQQSANAAAAAANGWGSRYH
ncbi:hypothetical protein DFJ73DRAFT_411107 [Zopfochytrium polystomum]|nr:hypothetical protein DFJ73DRAFT_411107 [Zopfochytrium polystomum]